MPTVSGFGFPVYATTIPVFISIEKKTGNIIKFFPLYIFCDLNAQI